MIISAKEKNTHHSWLISKLTLRCKGGSIAQDMEGNILNFSLKLSPHFGKSKDIPPPFHGKGKGMGDRLFSWRFLESWQTLKNNRYQYCRLSLQIADNGGSEMLSVHWNNPCPITEPYQPHWHFSLDRDGYYLRKVHIPLDSNWGKSFPRTLDDYHKWVEGLLAFLEGEFANSLKRKRAS